MPHKDPEDRRRYHRAYGKRRMARIRKSPKLLAAYLKKACEQSKRYARMHPDRVKATARNCRIKKRLAEGKTPIGKRGPIPRSITERFWTKVVKHLKGCWEWKGATHEFGYGRIDNQQAHRVSWRIHFGDIPNGLGVLHQCDNPPCTRPDHLFLGTPLDNSKDAVAKGRMKRPPRTHCKRRHKLTPTNTYSWRGKRLCKKCIKAYGAARYRRLKCLQR